MSLSGLLARCQELPFSCSCSRTCQVPWFCEITRGARGGSTFTLPRCSDHVIRLGPDCSDLIASACAKSARPDVQPVTSLAAAGLHVRLESYVGMCGKVPSCSRAWHARSWSHARAEHLEEFRAEQHSIGPCPGCMVRMVYLAHLSGPVGRTAPNLDARREGWLGGPGSTELQPAAEYTYLFSVLGMLELPPFAGSCLISRPDWVCCDETP